MTWVPALKPAGHLVFQGAQRTLVVTLFLIGGGLSRAALATVGQRPLVQGFLLWILMASATLGAIVMGWIQLRAAGFQIDASAAISIACADVRRLPAHRAQCC